MCTGLHVFLSDFHETWICSTDFRKILKYQIILKSFQWGRGGDRVVQCGRTEKRDEANGRF